MTKAQTAILQSQSDGAPSLTEKKPVSRMLSIDALRGFDMFWLIGGAELFKSFDEIFHNSFTAWLSLQFKHTTWIGPRFEDFIFPLFLFIVGVVTPVSIGRMKQKGMPLKTIYLHIIKRTAVLMLLGMISKGLLHGNVTIVSVLSRIGFSYFVAALFVLHTGPRFQAIFSGLVLLLSWPAMMLIPVPGLPENHIYLMEGAAKYIPVLSQSAIWFMSIPSTLAGCLAGYWLFSDRGPTEKAYKLFVAGFVCALLGLVWGMLYPRVFSLWTGSFVVYMAGCSTMLLALFYYIIDIKGFSKWSKFFVIIGSNAIFIYFLRVTSIINWDSVADFFVGGIMAHAGVFAATIHALGVVAVLWSINAFLYRHKIFIKA